jgi:hypothetical protein
VNATRLRAWWAKRGAAILTITVAAMAIAALWRLGNELPRLLWETDGPGGFDLRLRLREVQRWFAGLSVYDEVERGDYPPASYVLLWPLLGWTREPLARLLWAATSLVALAALSLIAIRGSRATTPRLVLLAGLLPFSVYASSAAIRVGQLGNHVLPLVVGGILLLRSRRGRAGTDLVATVLLLGALVKPTLAAPFCWIVCFAPPRIRPIALLALGYAGLSLFAVSFQEGETFALLTGWLAEGPQVRQGHANIHKWLTLAGLRHLASPASLTTLALLGWWVFRRRAADTWILLGVCAIVAHFWMPHRLYDDVLILVPMIALLRLAAAGPRADQGDVTAAILFGATWITMHAPAGLLALGPPVSTAMEIAQTAVWVAVLALLVRTARVPPPVASDDERGPTGIRS